MVRVSTSKRLKFNKGLTMKELVMIGFSEKFRAVEVLPQLQRLKFDWSADLRTAAAVEVEVDGKLRLSHSQLLDPASGLNDALQWKTILNAVVPLPHIPSGSTAERSRTLTLFMPNPPHSSSSNWFRRHNWLCGLLLTCRVEPPFTFSPAAASSLQIRRLPVTNGLRFSSAQTLRTLSAPFRALASNRVPPKLNK
jgi:hypothetical protein